LYFRFEKVFALCLDLDRVLLNQHWIWIAKYDSPLIRGVKGQDFRTRIRQASAYFEQTVLGPDYGFIQVSRSGLSNFIVLGLDAKTQS